MPPSAQRERGLRRWLLGARVVLARRKLDGLLARGAGPGESPALAMRASQLLRPGYRARLARDLQRLIEESEHRRPRFSAAVPIRNQEVLLAREELLALIDALRDADWLYPRGVAMLTTLLIDSGSPLYTGGGDLLELYLERARHHLLEDPWR